MKTRRTFDIVDLLQKNMPWVLLVVIGAIFSFLSPNFLTFNNIINILNQNAYVIIAALGVAMIMISGAIDLSVGYQMSLIGIVCGIAHVRAQWPVAATIALAILLGVVVNLLNMVLSFKLRLPLMMISFGTMTIFQGVSFVLSNSQTIGGFSMPFKFLGQGYIGPIPLPVIIAALLFILMSFFLNRTYIGRYVYALGGNTEGARLAGINVTAVKSMISVLSGVFIGLSTTLLMSRIGSVSSSTGPGTEFTIITGVLLGGVSVRGGEGRLAGVVAGILILAILVNGMQLAGMGIYFQYIAKGAIMLMAIGFDVYQLSRRSAAKAGKIREYIRK